MRYMVDSIQDGLFSPNFEISIYYEQVVDDICTYIIKIIFQVTLAE